MLRYLNEVFEILVDRILAFVGQMCEPHLIEALGCRCVQQRLHTSMHTNGIDSPAALLRHRNLI